MSAWKWPGTMLVLGLMLLGACNQPSGTTDVLKNPAEGYEIGRASCRERV